MSGSGFVVWFTGLSGAGKSTLATLLAAELAARGAHVEVLDGDELRTHLSKGLTFSREDRDVNVRRIGYVAKLLGRSGAVAITAAISPYRATRDEQRAAIGRFVEVYCKCSIDALSKRDPKGLYKKALAGEIPHFTGVTDPYEEPTSPDVEVDTGQRTVDECLSDILRAIEERGYLDAPRAARAALPWGGQRFATSIRSASEPPEGRLEIDERSADLCEGVELGSLAPLRGPLGEKDATKLAKEGRLESGVAWPLAWTLSLPEGADGWPKGALVELVAPKGRPFAPKGRPFAPEVGQRQYLLEVTETWVDARGVKNFAGDVVTRAPTSALDVGQRLGASDVEEPAFMLLRAPIEEADELLLDIGLETRGSVALVVASRDPRVHASASRFVQRRGLAESIRIGSIPPLPTLDPDRDPLLQVVVLRNVGARAAILSCAEGLADPRTVLSGLRQSEIGLEIVAAGPVTRRPDGRLATKRMGTR